MNEQKGMKHSVNENGSDKRFRDSETKRYNLDCYSVCTPGRAIRLRYDECWVSRKFTPDMAYEEWGKPKRRRL